MKPVILRQKTIHDDWSVLACPKCGENNLHHGAVTIYYRSEDAKTTQITTSDGNTLLRHHVSSPDSGNPSARRDGIAIRFSCEYCDGYGKGNLELAIWQHKGETFAKWREYGDRDPET